jgi:hypothetical protein
MKYLICIFLFLFQSSTLNLNYNKKIKYCIEKKTIINQKFINLKIYNPNKESYLLILDTIYFDQDLNLFPNTIIRSKNNEVNKKYEISKIGLQEYNNLDIYDKISNMLKIVIKPNNTSTIKINMPNILFENENAYEKFEKKFDKEYSVSYFKVNKKNRYKIQIQYIIDDNIIELLKIDTEIKKYLEDGCKLITNFSTNESKLIIK